MKIYTYFRDVLRIKDEARFQWIMQVTLSYLCIQYVQVWACYWFLSIYLLKIKHTLQ